MKFVMVYETADGKQFEDRADARRHEAELDTLQALRTLLKASIDSAMTTRGNVDNVLRHILLENSEVRKILLSYSKKAPKEHAAA